MPKEKYKYWIEISDDDFDTAKMLYKKKKYLYSGYFLQQSIEKILKGYYQFYKNDFPPRTHNLVYIAEISGILVEMTEEQKETLYNLNPLNIETRYPEYRDKISSSLNKTKIKNILTATKELRSWIKKKL
jgi:HEPN domain-containing protein